MYDYAPTLSKLFSEDTCQQIEEKSHAVLIRDSDCRLIIQGSDQMHVLLAVSIIEDIVARVETNVSASSGHKSSAMLDEVLERAYSHHGQAEDGFDWSTMPEEVKRAVLVSLLDSDEPEVTFVDVEGIADEQTESVATAEADVVVSSSASHSCATTPASVSDALSSVTVSKVVDLPPKLDITSPAIQPLVRLATSKGYTLEEIENVLHSKSSHLKESEFLRTLHTTRRLQSATSQQASVSSAFLHQPAASLVSIANSASSRSADETVHTSGRSLICSVTGSKDVHLQKVGTGSVKGACGSDVKRCVESDDDIVDDSTTQVSSAAVILLKSDQEEESCDDDDSDNKNMDIDIDVNQQLMALAYEGILYESAVPCAEQNQKNVAVESGGSSRRKKNKRKKKQLLCHTTVRQKEKPPPTAKTGNDVSELDCISLIPATKPAAVDKSKSVVFVSDSSDGEIIDISEDTGSWKPVVRKERREFVCRKEERNQFPLMHSSSNSGNTSENKNHQNTRQLNNPVPAFTSVPAVATGYLNVLLFTARIARMYRFCLVCVYVCPGAKN